MMGHGHTFFLCSNLSIRSFLAASSCPCLMRCSFRLWKPVRYSARASKSKGISSTLAEAILRLLAGGPIDRVE